VPNILKCFALYLSPFFSNFPAKNRHPDFFFINYYKGNYPISSVIDPKGPSTDVGRVRRGAAGLAI
jgi:hypothetical protein